MLENYAIYAGGLIAGILVGLYLVGTSILAASYGIPLAIRLKNRGFLSGSATVRRYAIWILSALAIFALISVLSFLFFQPALPAFLLGVGFMAAKVGNSKVRYSFDNFPDFVSYAKGELDPALLIYSEDELKAIIDLNDVRGIPGDELFFRVFGDTVSNSFVSGLWVLIAVLLAKLSWWAGLAVAAIFTIIEAIDLVQVIISLAFGLVGLFLAIAKRKDAGEAERSEAYWLAACSVPRLLGTIISIGYLYLLYSTFFA